MLIKFKKLHTNAKIPTQAEGDVGFDLYSREDVLIQAGRVSKVNLGLAIADYDPVRVMQGPKFIKTDAGTDMVMQCTELTVYPKIEGRSSLGAKGIFTIAGIIDPSYRGELTVTLANMTGRDYQVGMGDRVAQFVFYTCLTSPELEFEETDTIVPTVRGDKGFGSTGR